MPGTTCLIGGAGFDILDGGPGVDWLNASDFSFADHVQCGAGLDTWEGEEIRPDLGLRVPVPERIVRRLVLTAALAALVLPASAGAASRPDLTVSAVKLSGAQVTGKVRNAGRAGAKKTTLEIVVSADGRRDARDTRVATVSLKALKARKTATFKATVRAPATLAGGRYTVLACADPSKKVRESKETNNCRAASAKLTIAAPAPAAGAARRARAVPGAGRDATRADADPDGPDARPEITSGPSGTVDSDAAMFTFTGTGPFECRLDGGALAACTSPRTYTNLPGGAHSFEVRSRARPGAPRLDRRLRGARARPDRSARARSRALPHPRPRPASRR